MTKHLKGTINDPFRAASFVPDHFRSLGDRNGMVSFSDIGFADSGSESSNSPALRRQLSLLNGDRDADYFLFDNLDRPIRFRIPDSFLRMQFRMMRSNLFSEGLEGKGFQPVAEYLMKMMQGHPGLGRERILGQLKDEYGNGAEKKLTQWLELAVTNGLAPGETFLEHMDGTLTETMPRMMSLHPEIMRAMSGSQRKC